MNNIDDVKTISAQNKKKKKRRPHLNCCAPKFNNFASSYILLVSLHVSSSLKIFGMQLPNFIIYELDNTSQNCLDSGFHFLIPSRNDWNPIPSGLNLIRGLEAVSTAPAHFSPSTGSMFQEKAMAI